MIPGILARAQRLYSSQVAVIEGGRSTTYAELADRVARIATVLRDLCGGPGRRLAFLGGNTQSFLETYFASAHAGTILVPLNSRLSSAGLVRLLEFVDCSVLVHDSNSTALAQQCQALAPGLVRECFDALSGIDLDARISVAPTASVHDASASDVVQVYFTSGSTGEPKGVKLTHRNVCSHAVMALAALGMDDRDQWGHIAPLFHLADAWACFAGAWVGAVHRMVPRFQVERVLEELSTGVTMTNLVPTMLTDLVHAPTARDREYTLRRVLSGGAPIAAALVDKVVATFHCDYIQTYGLTETSPFLTMSMPRGRPQPDALEARRQRDRTGRPLPGIELRVVDESGCEVAADDRSVGEITVRGDSVTPGYWNNDVATAAAFRSGWFLTGDLAVVDDVGSVRIVDRKKDVILTGGETVYSTEVEAVIAAHPEVREVAVFGVPHARWGEAVVAAVVRVQDPGVPARELSDREILEWCAARLGGPLRPRRVFFRDALPRTGTNKIAKRSLREEYETTFSAE